MRERWYRLNNVIATSINGIDVEVVKTENGSYEGRIHTTGLSFVHCRSKNLGLVMKETTEIARILSDHFVLFGDGVLPSIPSSRRTSQTEECRKICELIYANAIGCLNEYKGEPF